MPGTPKSASLDTESKSIASPTAADKQKLYESKLAEYKTTTQGFSSLFKHILCVLDKNNFSSSSSIAKKLKDMHGSGADIKGFFIHAFNSLHRGGKTCAFFNDTVLAPSLHLGTTRIWKEDGYINEEQWQKLLAHAAEENNTIITLSRLLAYLAECTEKDPEENKTGRHSTPYFPVSKSIQTLAAVQAWKEVYDRLTCGWKTIPGKAGEMEPYISVNVIREFFEDSPVAYLRAECKLLPVLKPEIAVSIKPAFA